MAKLTVNKTPTKRDVDGNPSKGELLRRIRKLEPNNIPPDEILTASPFTDLFQIKPETLKNVIESMKESGYDSTQPVIVWKEQNVLIDGHTRKLAAIEAGLVEIPVEYVSMPDEQTAIEYARSLQFSRRNLTDADLFTFLEGIDLSSLPGKGKKKKKVASLCGISETKAVRLLYVLSLPESVRRSIRNGEATINQSYDKSKKRGSDEPPDKQGDNNPKLGGYTSNTSPEKTSLQPGMNNVSEGVRALPSISTRLIKKHGNSPQGEGIREFIREIHKAGLLTDTELKTILGDTNA